MQVVYKQLAIKMKGLNLFPGKISMLIATPLLSLFLFDYLVLAKRLLLFVGNTSRVYSIAKGKEKII